MGDLEDPGVNSAAGAEMTRILDDPGSIRTGCPIGQAPAGELGMNLRAGRKIDAIGEVMESVLSSRDNSRRRRVIADLC